MSSPMEAIYNEGLVGVCEEASSGETYCSISLMKLLYDGILLNRCPPRVITDIDECWWRAGDESLDALECCCRGIVVSVE